MQIQVDKSHYEFSNYLEKRRWASMWHQLDEVIKFKPNIILEIGPGPGVFKAVATVLGHNVKTLDIDPELRPDYVASVFSMPFEKASFDVVCAFQMLEHLPYLRSLEAFSEMVRVAGSAVIISLPDAAKRWPIGIYIPKFGMKWYSIPKLRLRPEKHIFDGEHYWEINKKNYPLSKIVNDFVAVNGVDLIKTYRVGEYPYHRFFIFKKV